MGMGPVRITDRKEVQRFVNLDLPICRADSDSLECLLDDGVVTRIHSEWSVLVERMGDGEFPPHIKSENGRLYGKFACRPYYVLIEKVRDSFFYVMRWRNGEMLRRPLIIAGYPGFNIGSS